MIPAIDVPTELANCKSASDNLTKQEELLALKTKNYRQDSIKPIMITGAESDRLAWLKLIEKSVIIHCDENGFGLRIKGQLPVFVEHVHENGAAWRAGVRPMDRLSKINGISVANMDHKEVVLIFKSCSRFIGLTLLTCLESYADSRSQSASHSRQPSSCGRSSLTGSIRFVLEDSPNTIEDDHDNNATSASWLYPTEHSLYDHQARSYYEDSIGAAHQQLAVGKSAHRSQSSQSFNATHLKLKQSKLNGNLNYCTNYPQPKSPTLSARNASPMFKKQLAADSFCTGKAAAARRSESVSLRPSYLSKQQQLSIPPDSNEQHISGGLVDHQNVATCINCRSRIVGNISSPNNLKTCLDCQQSQVSGGLRQKSQTSFDYEELLRTRDVKLNMDPIKNQLTQKLTQSASVISLDCIAKVGGENEKTAVANGLTKQLPVVNKRIEIIKEFIDTEKTHTDRLKCLDELFYRPLKAGNYMTSEQLRMVFSCHRTLYKIHRQIYRILRSANFGLFSEPFVGSALREIFESDIKRRLERAACSFCAAQSTNVELLNKLTRRETKVGDFIALVTSQQMIGRLGIKDLLASCFQRLTKYPLLLENLLKATPIPPVISKKRCHRNVELASEQETKRGSDEHGGEILEDEDDEDEEEEVRNARRMLAISLAEEREFIERALQQSRQMLVKVNESVKVAMSRNKLREIWKRTDKYPGVPLIDITNQHMVHEGSLTLRLSKRSFDVYVLLLSDYIIILTREGQDKYRLKFFTPEGKSSGLTSSSTNTQTVYSPVFIIDEHLTTRDAATDENGFYLLCKRKDDSRIYEFASRSPTERLKWRDRIQWTIERQIGIANRRPSCKLSLSSKFKFTVFLAVN